MVATTRESQVECTSHPISGKDRENVLSILSGKDRENILFIPSHGKSGRMYFSSSPRESRGECTFHPLSGNVRENQDFLGNLHRDLGN